MCRDRALIAAIRFFGSQSNLAKNLKLNRKIINNWLNRGDEVPFEYAIAIEILTRGEVDRYALAPYAAWLKRLQRSNNSHLAKRNVTRFTS